MSPTTCPSCNAVYDLAKPHPQSGIPVPEVHTIDNRGLPCRFAGQVATASKDDQRLFATPQADLAQQVADLQARVAALQAAQPAPAPAARTARTAGGGG
jgi:hypothetical protein